MGKRKDAATTRRSLILRAIYAVCLLGATYNHAATIVHHGLLWDYGGVPRASALFWTSLTLLDPAAVLLLWLRPNAGIAATTAIIVADVIHNLWLTARYAPPVLHKLLEEPMLAGQVAFMIFVLASVRFAWTRRMPVRSG